MGWKNILIKISHKFLRIRKEISSQKSNTMRLHLLVVLGLLISYTLAISFPAEDEDDEDIEMNETFLEKRGWVRRVSLICTGKCAKWWYCRVRSLFRDYCARPTQCNCAQFAWEKKKPIA